MSINRDQLDGNPQLINFSSQVIIKKTDFDRLIKLATACLHYRREKPEVITQVLSLNIQNSLQSFAKIQKILSQLVFENLKGTKQETNPDISLCFNLDELMKLYNKESTPRNNTITGLFNTQKAANSVQATKPQVTGGLVAGVDLPKKDQFLAHLQPIASKPLESTTSGNSQPAPAQSTSNGLRLNQSNPQAAEPNTKPVSKDQNNSNLAGPSLFSEKPQVSHLVQTKELFEGDGLFVAKPQSGAANPTGLTFAPTTQPEYPRAQGGLFTSPSPPAASAKPTEGTFTKNNTLGVARVPGGVFNTPPEGFFALSPDQILSQKTGFCPNAVEPKPQDKPVVFTMPPGGFFAQTASIFDRPLQPLVPATLAPTSSIFGGPSPDPLSKPFGSLFTDPPRPQPSVSTNTPPVGASLFGPLSNQGEIFSSKPNRA